MKYRDLEKVRKIVKNATNLDISYAYDDLVFPEHAVFIIQYDDKKEDSFFCHFREECEPEEKKRIMADLIKSFRDEKCTIAEKGKFRLEQKGEMIDVHFN